MADDIQVRVDGRSFTYRGETYENGEELTVDEETVENHPQTLETVEEDGDEDGEGNPGDGSSGGDSDEFDPSDYNLDELEDALEDADASADELHERERDGRDREGAHDLIDDAVED